MASPFFCVEGIETHGSRRLYRRVGFHYFQLVKFVESLLEVAPDLITDLRDQLLIVHPLLCESLVNCCAGASLPLLRKTFAEVSEFARLRNGA